MTPADDIHYELLETKGALAEARREIERLTLVDNAARLWALARTPRERMERGRALTALLYPPVRSPEKDPGQ